MINFREKIRSRLTVSFLLSLCFLLCTYFSVTLLGGAGADSLLLGTQSNISKVDSSDSALNGEMSSGHIFISSSGSDSNDGLSSSAPVETLSKALDLIASNSSVNTIEFLNPITISTNTTLTNGAGKDVYFIKTSGFSGEGMILYGTSSITLTLDGDDSSTNDVVERFIFDGEKDSGKTGRAIYSDYRENVANFSFITFENFKNNSYGGVLFFENCYYCSYFSNNCNYINNETTGTSVSGGVGYFLDGNLTTFSSTNDYFYNNVSNNSAGCFRINSGSKEILLTDSIFENNEARSSGGVFWIGQGNVEKFESIRCSYINNKSLIDSAGVIYLYSRSFTNIEFVQSNFSGNTAEDSGGAMYLGGYFITINLIDTSFNNNLSNGTSATYGGGCIMGLNVAYFSLEYTNNDGSIVGNQSKSVGGVFYVDGINGGDAYIDTKNCDIRDNLTASGDHFVYNNLTLNENKLDSFKEGVVYISNSGNDNNNGTAIDSPVLSIGKALEIVESNENINTIEFINSITVESDSDFSLINNTGKDVYFVMSENFSENDGTRMLNLKAKKSNITFTLQGDDLETDSIEKFIFDGEFFNGRTGSAISASVNGCDVNFSNLVFQNFLCNDYRVVNITAAGTIQGSNCEFRKNFLGYVGYNFNSVLGLFADNASLTECEFINNSLKQSYDPAILHISLEETFNSKSCVFDDNILLESGGQIYFYEVKNYISKNDIFNGEENSSRALYFESYVESYYSENTKFVNNSEDSGGAIYFEVGINEYKSINNIFQNNTASEFGGAIYSPYIINYISEEDIFINNTSVEGGGAIYIGNTSSSNIDLINTNFDNNETGSSGYGGAIYALKVEHIKIEFTLEGGYITNNTAYFGGAFYIEGINGGNAYINYSTFNSSGNNTTSGGKDFVFNNLTVLEEEIVFTTGRVYISNSGNDNNSGLDSDNPVLTIVKAIEIISLNSSLNTIEFLTSITISSSLIINNVTGRDVYFVMSDNFVEDYMILYGNNEISITINGDDASTTNKIEKFIFDGEKNKGKYGGAIYSEKSDVSVSFSNISFQNFRSSAVGGAIYFAYEVTTCNIEDTDFSSNVANNYGGAICFSRTVTDFSVINCIFNNNISSEGGGAIYFYKVINYSSQECNFENNSVLSGRYGAAIYINSVTNYSSYKDCFNNHIAHRGGALYISSATTFMMDSSEILNSGTIDDAFNGGAGIYFKGSLDYFKAINCKFNNNTLSSYQPDGGSAILFNGKVNKFEITNCQFDANDNYSIITFDNYEVNEIIVKDCVFSNNTKTDGIYFYKKVNVATFINCKFIDNVGRNDVVCLNFREGVNTLSIKDSIFENNKGNSIGAIYIQKNVNIMQIENTTFKKNTAYRSGAIYVSGSSSTSNKTNISIIDCNFDGNKSTSTSSSYGGGAIYANYVDTFQFNYTKACSFINNSGYKGGAVWIIGRGAGSSILLEYLNGSDTSGNSSRNGKNFLYENIEVVYDPMDMFKVYISSSGSNSNSGLLPGEPVLTISKALEILKENSNYTILQFLTPITITQNTTITNSTGKTIYFIMADGFSGEGMILYGSSNITLTINGSTSGGATKIIFDGQKDKGKTGRAIYSSYSSISIDISNASFQSFKNSSDGGAIYFRKTVTTCNITGTTFSGNSGSNGGAIYFSSSVTTCNIEGTTFSGNSSSNYGGAICFINSVTTCNITDTTFSGNSTSYYGGAICFNYFVTTCNIEGTTFSGNSGSNGGAICFFSVTTCNITDSTFNDNSSSYGGGAIYVSGSSSTSNKTNISIIDCNFDGNKSTSTSSSYGGGAIYANYVDTFQFNYTKACSFINNSGYKGGAVWIIGRGAGSSILLEYLNGSDTSGNSSKSGENFLYENIEVVYDPMDFIKVYISSSGSDSNDGLSSSTPVQTLARALEVIKTNGGLNSIMFLTPITITTDTTITNDTGKSIYFVMGDGFSGEGMILYGASNTTLTINGSTSGGATKIIFDGQKDRGKTGRAIYSSYSSISIDISNASFQSFKNSSDGGAIYFRNTVTTCNITGTTFTGNSGSSGGAIYFNNSVTTCNITDTTFSGNSASSRGGAIYFSSSVSSCNITDSTFSDNSASYYGGAIYFNSSVTTCNIEGTTFSGNSGSNGGAIWFFSVTTCNITDSTFNDNSSSYGGGAIYFNKSVQLCEISDTIFDNNTAGSNGGAIYFNNSVQLCEISDTIFDNNTAGSNGGAIYSASSNSSFSVQNCDFTNNISSANGGAIYLSSANSLSIVNDDGKTHYFNNNTANAGNGGFLYINACAGSSDDNGVKINLSNTQLNNNIAAGAGGVFYVYGCNNASINLNNCQVNSNKANSSVGGAIYLGYSKSVSLTISSTNIDGNYAKNPGGAIWSNSLSVFTFTNGSVSDNEALVGGGIYINLSSEYSTSLDVVLNNVDFYNNTATGSFDLGTSSTNDLSGVVSGGGAIFCTRSLDITNCDFVGNSAQGDGGAIYSNGASSFSFIANDGETHYYNDNSAGGDNGSGGLVYLNNCNYSGDGTGIVIDLDNAQINNNSSTGSGGAFYINGDIVTFNISNCSVNSNSASVSGGAIYIEKTIDIVNLSNSSFCDNVASYGSGGAIRFMGVTTKITSTDNKFNDNSAKFGYGGAILFNYTVGEFYSSNSTYDYNVSTGGGAIYFNYKLGKFNANLDSYSNNYASEESGGGIFIQNSPDLIFTMENSQASSNYAGGNGGGINFIYSSNSQITITNSQINNNIAELYGGGINIEYCSSATISIDGSSVSGNLSFITTGNNSGGGGIRVYSSNATIFTIESSKVNNNISYGWGGGILLASNASELIFKMINCDCSENIAVVGGGLAFVTNTELSQINIENTTINNNNATSRGGAIWINSYKLLNISGGSISNNTSPNEAGICVEFMNDSISDDNNILDLSNIHFDGNISTSKRTINDNGTYEYGGVDVGAGAIFSSRPINIESCYFTNNSAVGNGGAIYCPRDVNITNSFFENNSSDMSGGGIYCEGILNLYNVNFTENSAKANGTTTGGGGVYANSLEYSVGIVENNSTSGAGGGVYASSGSISLVTFNQNSAGKLGGGASLLSGEITECKFEFNSSNENGGGVAISLVNGTLATVFKENTLTNNSATNFGGGLYFGDETKGVSLSLSDTNFSANSAKDGGAIYSQSSISLRDVNFSANRTQTTDDSPAGAVVTLSRSSENALTNSLVFEYINGDFANNTTNGGGLLKVLGTPQYMADITLENIDIYANVEKVDGILQLGKNANVLLNDVNFYSNIAVKGGAISIDSNTTITSYGLLFSRNSATYGSTLYLKTGAEFTLRDVEFANSTSTNGIIYTEPQSKLYIYGTITEVDGERKSTSTIKNNVGEENGSFLYALGTVVFNGVDIDSNRSDLTGGAIYIGDGGQVTLNNTLVRNNFAGTLNEDGSKEITEENLGGAVFVGANGTLIIDGKTFVTNNSAYNGGAIYVDNLGSVNMLSSFVVEYEEYFDEDTGITHNKPVIKEYFGEISSNSALNGGGGVYIARGGSSSIKKGIISLNTANFGAGIYNDGSIILSGGEIINNTINSSSLNKKGAGIYNYGSLIVTSGKISNNNTNGGFGGGVYAFENSYQIFENCEISNNIAENGAGLFLENGLSVTFDNCVISSNIFGGASTTQIKFDTGIAIYSQSSNLYFKDCEISKNGGEGNASGNIIYIGSGICKIDGGYIFGNQAEYILDFGLEGENSPSYADNQAFINKTVFGKDSAGLINGNKGNFIFSSDNLEIINIDFSNNQGSIIIYSSKSLIENSSFTNNSKGGAISTTGSKIVDIVIKDSIFTNNSNSGANGGAINLTNIQPNSAVTLDNVEFNSNSASCGGAIYVGSNGTLMFANSIKFNSNTADSKKGSAIYVESGCGLVLKKDLFVEMGENDVLVTNNSKILEGPLNENSNVNYLFVGAIDGSVVLESYMDTLPIFHNTIKNNFSYTDDNYLLQLNVSNTSPSTSYQVVLKEIDQSSKQVIFNDLVFNKKTSSGSDGGVYTISKSDFEVTWANEWNLLFYDEDLDSWVEDSPEFKIVGDYTVKFRVVDVNDDENYVEDTINVSVIENVLYLVDVPQAVLTYNSSSSTTTTSAQFKNGRVVDSNGNVVAGTWAFVNDTVSITNISQKYEIVFTPANQSGFANTITTSAYVDIYYDKVFYISGNFYADRTNLNYRTGITKLSQMVEYMQDGGLIIFENTYLVNADEKIVADKKIYFSKYVSFNNQPLIKVADSGTETPYVFELSGGSGLIGFEGKGSLTHDVDYNKNAYSPIIENHGKLIIGSNVYIRNYKIYDDTSVTTNDIYSLIYNASSGEMILNGCEIYNNRIYSITGYDYGEDYRFGGIIYNEGILTINSGRFFSNYLSDEGGTRDLYGGFVFNLGEFTMNGGSIFMNNAEFGGAIYVGNNASTRLNGGEIYANYASSSGGAIYVDLGGKLVLSGTDIYNNISAGTNASIGMPSDTSAGVPPIIVQSNGENVTGEMLQEIESKNIIQKENNSDYLLLILSVLLLVVGFVFAVVYRKNRYKYSYFKIKKIK